MASDSLFTICKLNTFSREWETILDSYDLPLTFTTLDAAMGNLHVFTDFIYRGDTCALFRAGCMVGAARTIENKEWRKRK